MKEAAQHTVRLTPTAAEYIQQAFQAQQVNTAQAYVRVGAVPGGCSGYKYALDFAEADDVAADDLVFQSHGLNLLVDKHCLRDILGSVQIDYRSSNNMVERGFVFQRLGSGAQCGCGESFTPSSGQEEEAHS